MNPKSLVSKSFYQLKKSFTIDFIFKKNERCKRNHTVFKLILKRKIMLKNLFLLLLQ